MTAFFPAEHVRGATGDIARSALPDAPIRPFVPATAPGHRSRTRLGNALISLGRRLRPGDPHLDEPREPVLVDEPYTAWRAEAVLGADGLQAWREAAPEDRPAAYAAYCAAVDREEAAARELARAVGVPSAASGR
jgi:hypothetical protein